MWKKNRKYSWNKDYICKVVNNENQTYIDNLKIYFKDNWENSDYDTKRDEILTNIFQSFSFAIYKYWSYKIIECLNPFHRIFSGSFYYILQRTIFFIVNSNKIINNEDIYLKYKILLDLLEDFLNVLTFLIYTEIIELNFCKLNKNTRRNIQIRGDQDISGENESDSQRASLFEISPGYLIDDDSKSDTIEMRNQNVD